MLLVEGFMNRKVGFLVEYYVEFPWKKIQLAIGVCKVGSTEHNYIVYAHHVTFALQVQINDS